MVREDSETWMDEKGGKSLAFSLFDHGMRNVSDSSRLSLFHSLPVGGSCSYCLRGRRVDNRRNRLSWGYYWMWCAQTVKHNIVPY